MGSGTFAARERVQGPFWLITAADNNGCHGDQKSEADARAMAIDAPRGRFAPEEPMDEGVCT
jgi:hypothetical protein